MDLENLKEQADYWNQRWENNETGWHLPKPHDQLVEHIELIAPVPERDPQKRSRTIFVPLCGKTLDIDWLNSEGFHVVACELNKTAVENIFFDIGVAPRIVQQTLASGKTVTVYENNNQSIRIFNCNFFDLDHSFASVDATFDRAALVALPSQTRTEYAKHMMEITNLAPMLLVTFQHTRTRTPPHSITGEMVKEYYGAHYDILQLSVKCVYEDITETTSLLTPRK